MKVGGDGFRAGQKMFPTFDDFVTEAIKSNRRGSRSYVTEPGWKNMYIRVTEHYINKKQVKTIDLANIEAKKKGAGAFKKLVSKIRKKYPEFVIYVESILNKKFYDGLVRAGFVHHTEDQSVYLAPGQKLTWEDQ